MRMPHQDPTSPLVPLKRQFLRIMRWGALFSLAIAALAVALVGQGDETIHLHMLIATALGVGLSVLLGIALMTLVFLSSRMGQDADAADHSQRDKNDPRT
jgi:Na+-driven multidrug efflux pump